MADLTPEIYGAKAEDKPLINLRDMLILIGLIAIVLAIFFKPTSTLNCSTVNCSAIPAINIPPCPNTTCGNVTCTGTTLACNNTYNYYPVNTTYLVSTFYNVSNRTFCRTENMNLALLIRNGTNVTTANAIFLGNGSYIYLLSSEFNISISM